MLGVVRVVRVDAGKRLCSIFQSSFVSFLGSFAGSFVRAVRSLVADYANNECKILLKCV